MKKLWIPILIIIIIVVGIILVVQNNKNKQVDESKEPIKIGVLAPLTGNSASMGEGFRNGVLLAMEQMNDKDKKYNYEIVLEDDKAEPQTAATALQKLINIDKVDALISMGGVIGNVVAPIAQDNEIIHIGNTNSTEVAKGEFNFIHWTQSEEYAKSWIEQADKMGYKKVAILVYNNPAQIEELDYLKKEAEKKDVEIVNESIFDMSEKDFKTIILKAKEANPDIYFIGAFPPALELLMKQMTELGVNIPISCTQEFEFSKTPELFEGQWYSVTPNPPEEFTTAYNEKYGKMPVFTVGPAYDAFNLIVAAFEKSGKNLRTKPTSEETANAFLSIKNFLGILGTLNVDEQGIIHSPAIIKKVENGKFVPYEE